MGKRTGEPIGRPRADYTGQRRGRLLVKECLIPSDSFRNSWGLWKCICDCGKIVEVKGENIKARTKNSCGCLRTEMNKRGRMNQRRPDTLTLNDQYGTFKMRCKQINSSILSKDKWLDIVTKDCYYCGNIDIRNGIKNSYLRDNNMTITEEIKAMYDRPINGIDRVDNSIGYEFDNCVPCCTICNRMKSSHSKEQFLEKADTISKRHSYRSVSLQSFLCN